MTQGMPTRKRPAKSVVCFAVRGLVGGMPRLCGSATRGSIGIKEVSKYDTSFFYARRAGPPLIADRDFQHVRLGKSKRIRKLHAICLQRLSLKAVAISLLFPNAHPMWLLVVHPSVLLPLSPRPISPPARQDPAVVALKLYICVLVRPSASPLNPSSALHPTFVPVCLPTFHASTTPWLSSRRKNKPRKTGALPCPIPTRTWNQFTQTRKTYPLHLSRPYR